MRSLRVAACCRHVPACPFPANCTSQAAISLSEIIGNPSIDLLRRRRSERLGENNARVDNAREDNAREDYAREDYARKDYARKK